MGDFNRHNGNVVFFDKFIIRGAKMNQEYKKEARSGFFHYFRFWFLAVIIMLAITIIYGFFTYRQRSMTAPNGRGNMEAPVERVYDYAEVLSDSEEESLRTLIAEKEKLIQCDIVLVTINQGVEANGISWESGMKDYSDTFYDEKSYGYNMIHGDGVLLLDNWKEGEAGSWLCTTGKVYYNFGDREINRVLDRVYDYIETNPYIAYKAYVEEVAKLMQPEEVTKTSLPLSMVIFIPLIVLVIFIIKGLRPVGGKDTTTLGTYIPGNGMRMNVQRDDFIRRHVTSRRIVRNEDNGNRHSSGGGGRSSGGSRSGGGSHGGGGRRR
ncbi:TPM domain-containing protein [Lachnospiraceae bacterium OttesenSCG-928-D06]|nr:TPM domain-containing protein [Lachnospiraceae bacterium OttesenSCG-928-D06]